MFFRLDHYNVETIQEFKACTRQANIVMFIDKMDDKIVDLEFKSEEKAKACIEDIYEALESNQPVMTINKDDLAEK